jgi:leucine dehydrogenase
LTALGVLEAILATCERAFGDASLAGRSVCVLGLGHVGSRVARMCLRAGAAVTVSDVNPSLREPMVALGARWIDPHHAIRTRVDVLVPCALGALLTERSAAALRCRAIAGAANNQLQTDAVARLLARRQILWAPDFVANAGGLINIAAEIGGYDPVAARHRVRSIGDTLRRIYDRAARDRITPLAAAMLLAQANLQTAG